MHFSRLLIPSLFSLALPSLGSSPDNDYIRNVLADFVFVADSGSLTGRPKFSDFDKVLTPNVTFDFGISPPGVVRGLANVVNDFVQSNPPGTVTQNAVTTERISLSEFDDQGSASRATAKSYITSTYFGQGNLTGQSVALYVQLQDTLIKTKLQGNGGWRIDTRIARYF
ncbi:hypothetical protein MMC07_006450, partial [Pseudocyphellaria aurata]|nr:hypothetical protein [Pseudocyphellaria aurata]